MPAHLDSVWLSLLPSFLKRRIQGRQNLQRILGNTGWLFLDKALRMCVGLFVGIAVTRYLGPVQFGLISFATAFVALFGTIATMGLDGIVVREIVRYPSCREEILGTSFVLKLCGGGAVLFLTLGSVALLRPGSTSSLWLVGIVATGVVFQSFDVIDFWFQSQIESKFTVWARDTAFLLLSLVKVILILYKAPLIAFALAGLAEIVVGATGLIVLYQRYGQSIWRWRGDFDRAGKLLKESWPLLLSGAMISIYMKIDQIMIGSMMGDKAVGLYSAAISLSEIWYVIPTVISASIYPSLIRTYQDSEDKFYHRLKMVMGSFFWGALSLSAVIACFSTKIITTLYGMNYEAAGNVLAVHVFAGIFVSMGVVFNHKYVLDGTTRVNFVGTFFGALSNIILNIWLIPYWGIVGAAVATVISYLAPTVVLGVLIDRKIISTHIESVYYVLIKANYGKYK
jgi:polysaccharide transporter, PST family